MVVSRVPAQAAARVELLVFVLVLRVRCGTYIQWRCGSPYFVAEVEVGGEW